MLSMSSFREILGKYDNEEISISRFVFLLNEETEKEMIKFAEWIINEDWIQTTTGKWEQVDPPFLIAENNKELLEIYKQENNII